MKILFISSQALFSKTRFGGAKRLYYFAKELESNSELHVLCVDSCREFEDSDGFPKEFSNQLFLPSESLWKNRHKFAPERFRFLPGMTEIISRNRDVIDFFLKDHHFDATLFAYMPSLYFLELNRISLMGKLFYLEDDFVLENLRTTASQGKTWKQRAMAFLRYKQGLSFFQNKLRHFSSFICISRQEEDVIGKLFPFIPTHVLKYGIPMEDYPSLPVKENESVLGFIGNYHHQPNVDALEWLVNELFPYFSERVPNARLVLGGRHFPQKMLTECQGNSAIRILENVEEIADFYKEIGTFINPLRTGRGLRTKVIEAAAFGRSILSTSLGAEGLEELQIGLFENKEELIRAFHFMNQGGKVSEMAKRNRGFVEREFSLRKVGKDLKEILST